MGMNFQDVRILSAIPVVGSLAIHQQSFPCHVKTLTIAMRTTLFKKFFGTFKAIPSEAGDIPTVLKNKLSFQSSLNLKSTCLDLSFLWQTDLREK